MKKMSILFLLICLLIAQAGAASPLEQSPGQFSVKEIAPFFYVCVPYKGSFADMEKVIAILMPSIKSQNISVTGPMLGIYYNSPETTKPEDLVWEIGFPVQPQVMPQVPLEKKQWNMTTVAAGLHLGPYDEAGKTLNRMRDWMKANGYIPAGPVIERYNDMDPSKKKLETMITEIWIPCRKSGEVGEIIVLKVIVQLAKVMSQPDPTSSVVTQLKQGVLLESSGTAGSFYKVTVVDERGQSVPGYINRNSVEVASGAEKVKEQIPQPVPEKKEAPQVEERKPVAPKRVPPAARPRKAVSLELGFYYSLVNSYNRGLLDEWFAEVTGDPARLVDEGSPAFYNASGTLFFNVSSNFAIGVGGDVHISAPHALWGSQIFWGGRQEIVLSPLIIGVKMPFRIMTGGGGMSISLTATPSLLMGWVTGTYDNSASGTYWEFVPSSKMGFGISGGMEIFFGKGFGMGITAGMRMLTTGLAFDDPTSETGYSAPITSSGDEVTVDLGGMYVMTGLLIRF